MLLRIDNNNVNSEIMYIIINTKKFCLFVFVTFLIL